MWGQKRERAVVGQLPAGGGSGAFAEVGPWAEAAPGPPRGGVVRVCSLEASELMSGRRQEIWIKQ